MSEIRFNLSSYKSVLISYEMRNFMLTTESHGRVMYFNYFNVKSCLIA